MQISQKQGRWSKSQEKKPVRLEREYFLIISQRLTVVGIWKESADLDPWPLPVFSDNDTQLINWNTSNFFCLFLFIFNA